MAGYFVVKIDDEESKAAGEKSVKVTLSGHDDYKGSVRLDYTCVSNDANDPDPTLNITWGTVFLVGNNSSDRTVLVTGVGGQSVTFTAEATGQPGEYDVLSKVKTLPS